MRAKTGVDWASQALWLVGGLVAVLGLLSSGFIVHAVVIGLIALASVVWIEVLSTKSGTTRWMAFAGIMALGFLWGTSIDNREQRG